MLTADEFVNFTQSDLKCVNKSDFSQNIFKYKQFVNQLNELIESDKNSLNKVKKGVRTIYNSGIGHAHNELQFCELLERLVQSNDGDFDVDLDKVATGLCKFSVVMRDLSCKYKQLMQNLSSLVVYPLDMFLKGDMKNDAKKPFEKAIKDYEMKAEKLKKDRLSALNKENASTIYKPNADDPFDFSEDLERERRIVQMQLCEFLIKVNEMKSRKGAELVQQLIDYYRAQTDFFKDSLQTMEHMGMFMNDLVQHIDEIKNKHSDENQLLSNTRKELKSIIEKNTKQAALGVQLGYSLHQPQGNKAYGTSKEGWLLKKSDGMVKRVWQKRKVKLSGQSMMLYHGDDNKAPVILPMLTCHIKHPVGGEADSLCFDLISNNRTYNFRAEDDKSLEEWLSVLSNAKAAVFERAMSLDTNDDSLNYDSQYILDSHSFTNMNMTNNFVYTTHNRMMSSVISTKNDNDVSSIQNIKIIMKTIRKLDGNDKCADCGSIDPEWVSINLGVLICLECCGVHRELGVHHSRTQSLRMDTFYSSQLLLPRFVGNKLFNDIYEATLSDGVKPLPSDSAHRNDTNNIMQQRRTFIRSKYIDRKYVSGLSGDSKTCLKQDLLAAIQNSSIKDLIQAYAEGADLMTQFTPNDDPVWGSQLYSCIHLALLLAEHRPVHMANTCLSVYDINWGVGSNLKSNTSLLTIIEFILQNSPSVHLKRVNYKGDTILHQAIKSNQLDVTKIILKSGVVCGELISCKNEDNQTVIELAESLNKKDFVNLLNQTSSNLNKDYVNDLLDDLTIDWDFPKDVIALTESINQKDSPLQTYNNQPKQRSERIHSESSSSNKSDQYINFNHNALISNEQVPPHVKKDQKGASKSIFEFNPDSKIGIKTSSNPWNEVTLPRKKSLKGPAPEPPALRNTGDFDQCHLSFTTSNHATKSKPDVASKPKLPCSTTNSKQIIPIPKARTKSITPSNNYSTATLPRNMHSSNKPILSLHSNFLPLKEPEEGIHRKTYSNLKMSSSMSHSSDHIDVLLDVLEEPKKPLNAKEIHISQHNSVIPNKIDKISQVPDALTIGFRASARFNCKAENRDELSFKKGDIIIVKNHASDDGWWEGFLADNPSLTGMFPANFVQKLS